MRVWPFIGALAITALAACGGSDEQLSEAETSTPTDGSPTATVAEGTVQRPPGGPVPPELQGTWLFRSDAGPVRLYLTDDRYTVSAGGSAQGDVVVEGDVIAFFNSTGASCPRDPLPDVGRYRWTIRDEKLRLKLLGKDPCSGRASALSDVTFERSG